MGSVSLISSLTSSFDTQQTAAQAQQATQAAANAAQDTVKISAAAQIKALYHQGMSVKTIAADMGMTTETVNSYLNITEEKEIEQSLQAELSAKG